MSKQAKEFLEFVYEEPLLDIQQLNPCLYEHCEPLSTVLRLRQQLQSLRAYLFSCRATVAEDLRRRYEHCGTEMHFCSPAVIYFMWAVMRRYANILQIEMSRADWPEEFFKKIKFM